ncbi:MAG: tryptophan synthase subunit alpha, partial [Pseudomonadota bacterium]
MCKRQSKLDNIYACFRKAFVSYIMAGDPDYETSLEVVKGLPK